MARWQHWWELRQRKKKALELLMITGLSGQRMSSHDIGGRIAASPDVARRPHSQLGHNQSGQLILQCC